jgi:hypothetical protein
MPPKTNKLTVFETFRFQLLPITRNIQLTIDGSITSYDDLVKNKNRLLSDILVSQRLSFTHAGAKVTLRADRNNGMIFVFRLNVLRKLKRSTPDFKEEQIENYPAVSIVFNNHEATQMLAIEKNSKAFERTDIVSRLIEKNLNRFLREKNLQIYIEPIYSKENFWDIIKKYNGRIRRLEFQLIRPNMSNISSKIDQQLKALENSVDAHKMDLNLESSKDSTLIIDKKNERISGLVDYASEGGGKISVFIKGIRKKIQTANNPKEITIDSVDIKNASPAEVIDILKLFL